MHPEMYLSGYDFKLVIKKQETPKKLWARPRPQNSEGKVVPLTLAYLNRGAQAGRTLQKPVLPDSPLGPIVSRWPSRSFLGTRLLCLLSLLPL